VTVPCGRSSRCANYRLKRSKDNVTCRFLVVCHRLQSSVDYHLHLATMTDHVQDTENRRIRSATYKITPPSSSVAAAAAADDDDGDPPCGSGV